MLEHIHEVERAQTVYTQAQMQTHTKMKGNKIQQTESMQMPYGAVMFGHQNTFAALSVCGCMENSLTWNKICIENRNTAMWLESWHTHACSHRRQSDTALLLFPKHNDQNVHLPKNINFINILSFCASDVYFLQHFIWTENY